jgi:hypothetical protein
MGSVAPSRRAIPKRCQQRDIAPSFAKNDDTPVFECFAKASTPPVGGARRECHRRPRPAPSLYRDLRGIEQRPELSGEYMVQEDGTVSIPLLGSVAVAAQSEQQVQIARTRQPVEKLTQV